MLEGKKMFLRPMVPEDFGFMIRLLNDLSISYYEGRLQELATQKTQQTWYESLSQRQLALMVCDLDNEMPVGYVSAKIVKDVPRIGLVGIKLDKSSRGQGIGRDAVSTLCAFLFLRLNLHRIETSIVDYNKPSSALFKSMGWANEGNQRQAVYMNGKYHDNQLFSILKDEFLADENNSDYLSMIFGS